MRIAPQVVLIAGAASIIAGCATSEIHHKDKSSIPEINNRIVVNSSFNNVWDGLVREISKSFFVINNIEKDSRLINVSFSADKPSEYIDCGTTTVTSSHPSRGEQTWTYESADDSSYWMGIDGTNHIITITRNTDLSGRANIVLLPSENGHTSVTVNVKYVFEGDVDTRGVTASYYRNSTFTLDFSTNNPTTDEGMTCSSNGTLESELINMARRAAQ